MSRRTRCSRRSPASCSLAEWWPFAPARRASNEPAGRVGRALWAGAIGAALGGLLVGDPSLGWGVHGAFPALALLPSVLGSFWGGYHLWKFYDAVPRGLQGVALKQANDRDPRWRGAGGSSSGRCCACWERRSCSPASCIAIAQWTSGTNRLSLFVGFGCVALVTLLVNVLESLAYARWALFAALASIATELIVSNLVLRPMPRCPAAR